jgi:ATF/CREB family transcription factor
MLLLGDSEGIKLPGSSLNSGPLPRSKLDLEPNPFEQSFGGASNTSPNSPVEHSHKDSSKNAPTNNGSPKPTLPSLASLSAEQNLQWEGLRLSPMIHDPSQISNQPHSAKNFMAHTIHPIHPSSITPISNKYLPNAVFSDFQKPISKPGQGVPTAINPAGSNYGVSGIAYPAPITDHSQPILMNPNNPQPTAFVKINDSDIAIAPPIIPPPNSTLPVNGLYPLLPDPLDTKPPAFSSQFSKPTKRKSAGGRKRKPIDNLDQKRINFLERNRQAALKCRERKKRWLEDLQAKYDYLTAENVTLSATANSLREEIIHLRTLLINHQDCPVAQANNINVPKNFETSPRQTYVIKAEPAASNMLVDPNSMVYPMANPIPLPPYSKP